MCAEPALARRAPRALDKLAKPDRIKLSYAKVAEFQARGVIHFHALFRLDGYDPADPDTLLPPPPHLTSADLADAIRHTAAATWFATVPHPAKPAGWDINWGPQLDIRPVSITADGDISSGKVAGYLAKYATKAAEPAGLTAVRITADTSATTRQPPPTKAGSSAPAGNSAPTPTPPSRRCAAGRTCSATAATS
jgi:hypothetical protein